MAMGAPGNGAGDREAALQRRIEAQEADRRRIADSLHDGVIQSLTAATLRLQLLQSRWSEADRRVLDGVFVAVADAIDGLRDLVVELQRPIP